MRKLKHRGTILIEYTLIVAFLVVSAALMFNSNINSHISNIFSQTSERLSVESTSNSN